MAGAGRTETGEENLNRRHAQKKSWWLELRREALRRDMLEFNWESRVETLTQRLRFDRQLATRLIHERASPARRSDAWTLELGVRCMASR
jgi:hypothetical protein